MGEIRRLFISRCDVNVGISVNAGIGHNVNGSTRWLGIGPLGFQVSELAKFTIVIYMAGYLVRRNDEIQTQLTGFLKPMVILGTSLFYY